MSGLRGAYYGLAGAPVRTCYRCGQPVTLADARLCLGCRVKDRRKAKPGDPLSFRETSAAALITEGKSNKEIAWELGLTEGHVKQILHRVFVKLGKGNRTELAIWWVRNQPAQAETCRE